MAQITACLLDSVVDALDAVANSLRQSQAEVIREAIERCLGDFDDLPESVG